MPTNGLSIDTKTIMLVLGVFGIGTVGGGSATRFIGGERIEIAQEDTDECEAAQIHLRELLQIAIDGGAELRTEKDDVFERLLECRRECGGRSPNRPLKPTSMAESLKEGLSFVPLP